MRLSCSHAFRPLTTTPHAGPKSRDPRARDAGTGGPPDGTFKNLVNGGMETRSNGGNIKDEHTVRISNEPGTLSMANTGAPNSGGSQFFMVRSAELACVGGCHWSMRFLPPVFLRCSHRCRFCLLQNTVHNDFLDWFSAGSSKHPVFGKATDQASFDVMVAISKVPTRDDAPNTPVQMISVTVQM